MQNRKKQKERGKQKDQKKQEEQGRQKMSQEAEVERQLQTERTELNNLKILFWVNVFMLATGILMPQYFGIHIGWDITCLRFSNILLCLYALVNPWIITHFWNTVLRCTAFLPAACYLFVALYTMVLRTDINAFMLVFLEFLTFFMLIYGIRYVLGCRRAFQIILFCAYFLGIYGLVEFAAGHSLYLQFLRTVPTNVVNQYRSGHYRIMGPCGHPLGYGLLLLLFLAVACLDYEKDIVYLFKRPFLLGLLILNVFLTGSRSTLGIAALEILVLFLLSGRAEKCKSLLGMAAMAALLGIFLLLFHRTSIGQYVLLQITMLIDQIFDTEFSLAYGADMELLKNSEGYREYLPRIFTLDYLNPLVGRGVKRSFGAEFVTESGAIVYIKSIDNYYVQQYIKYAYPGLVSYCLFILAVIGTMLHYVRREKSGIYRVLLVAVCCYFFNLWYLDALQTLKFVYIIIALFYARAMGSDDGRKEC